MHLKGKVLAIHPIAEVNPVMMQCVIAQLTG